MPFRPMFTALARTISDRVIHGVRDRVRVLRPMRCIVQGGTSLGFRTLLGYRGTKGMRRMDKAVDVAQVVFALGTIGVGAAGLPSGAPTPDGAPTLGGNSRSSEARILGIRAETFARGLDSAHTFATGQRGEHRRQRRARSAGENEERLAARYSLKMSLLVYFNFVTRNDGYVARLFEIRYGLGEGTTTGMGSAQENVGFFYLRAGDPGQMLSWAIEDNLSVGIGNPPALGPHHLPHRVREVTR